jgi:type I restriction enzyme, S subunit
MKTSKMTIRDICTFIGGSQPPKSEFIYHPEPGYIRLVQTRDRLNDDFITFIPENSTKKLCEATDILIGRYGPPIFQVFRGFSGAYNVALMKAEPKSIIDKDYLYYFLLQNSILKYVESMSIRTGGQTGVEVDSLYDYPVNLPEIQYQKRVANLLKKMDAKIENNNKLISELQELSKLIYSYWFLQYEFPDKNGKPYKSFGGKTKYIQELDKDIPVEWELGKLENLGEIVAGGTPSTKKEEYYCEDGIAWITPKDLSNTRNMFIDRGEIDITEEGLNNSSAKLMPKGSILLTSRAPIGYISIATNDVCTNQGFKSIVPKNDKETLFIYYTILFMVPYLKSIGTGSTFTEISKDVVANVKVVIPPKKIIEQFHNRISKYSDSIKSLEEENKKLSQLRDFLLPLLINGRVIFNN